MLVTFGVCLNNTLILGIWWSAIPHLPRCFCPWTFFQNIGFNMVPSDPFMSYLATQLGYSAGGGGGGLGFATDCPCDVWCRWKSSFKQQLGCRIDIRDSISSFFCILTYAIIYVLIHHINVWLYLDFLNIVYFFKYSSTNIFHRRCLGTFYMKQVNGEHYIK